MFILLYQTNKKYILCRLKKGTIAIRFFSQNLVRNNQFHTGDKPYDRGDVRNRFSGPPSQKFLIPSSTYEKCFLFGRNWFSGPYQNFMVFGLK